MLKLNWRCAVESLTKINVNKAVLALRHKYKGKYPPGIEKKPETIYKDIEIARQWLDAQKIYKDLTPRFNISKSMNVWSGDCISNFSVLVAAHMHPKIKCDYPLFNIGESAILPRSERLIKIGTAYEPKSARYKLLISERLGNSYE